MRITEVLIRESAFEVSRHTSAIQISLLLLLLLLFIPLIVKVPGD